MPEGFEDLVNAKSLAMSPCDSERLAWFLILWRGNPVDGAYLIPNTDATDIAEKQDPDIFLHCAPVCLETWSKRMSSSLWC